MFFRIISCYVTVRVLSPLPLLEFRDIPALSSVKPPINSSGGLHLIEGEHSDIPLMFDTKNNIDIGFMEIYFEIKCSSSSPLLHQEYLSMLRECGYSVSKNIIRNRSTSMNSSYKMLK